MTAIDQVSEGVSAVYRYRSEDTLSEKLPIHGGVAASQLSYFNNNLVPYRPMVGKMSVRAPLNAAAKVLRAIWLPGLGLVWKTGIWSAAGPDWRVRRSRWFAL